MRRTLILAVVMVLMAAVVNAQDYLRAGQLVVAGATALTANRQTISEQGVTLKSTNTTTQGDLTGTYFFSRSIGIGVVLAVQNTSFTPPDENPKKTTSTTYSIGPTVAMRSGSGKISYEIGGGLGFGKHSAKKEGETTTAETNMSYFEGGGGLSYHINEAASFDVGLRYRKSTYKAKDPIDPKVTTSTDSSGLIFGVGFALYFGGR